MKIAIIGGGFAGLASAHYLKPFGEVTVFDPGTGSASSIAAGLLHKFVGMHAKKNLFSDEAFELSLNLIGPKIKTGLLRIAQTEDQAEWFRRAANDHPIELTLIDDKTLWIADAWVVDCPRYLAGLTKVKRTIHTLSELDEYDRIVITAGADCLNFFDLPITRVKGQLLEIMGSPSPSTPLSGQIYLIPLQDKDILGSTYERSGSIDAESELIPKLKALYPDYVVEKVLAIKSAERASAPFHLPFIKQMDHKTWVYSGLGSKGLLYHALYAKQLSEQMFKN